VVAQLGTPSRVAYTPPNGLRDTPVNDDDDDDESLPSINRLNKMVQAR
jgi:hypothetical protein